MFPGLDMYFVDPAQHLITAGKDLHDLNYLSVDYLSVHDLSARGVQGFIKHVQDCTHALGGKVFGIRGESIKL